MKTSKHVTLMLAIWVVCTAVVSAQRAEEPDFRYDTGAKIN